LSSDVDDDMSAILFSAANMIQRVLPRAFLSAGSQGLSVSSRLGAVYQAGPAAAGRPANPQSLVSYSNIRDRMIGAVRQTSGQTRQFAGRELERATAARRSGNKELAREILTMGLATLFPLKVAVDGKATSPTNRSGGESEAKPSKATPVLDPRATASMSRPEALHAGWQANLSRGVAALIARLDEHLHRQQRAVGELHVADYLDDYAAFRQAATLNDAGRPEDAVDLLRARPGYQSFLRHVQDLSEPSSSYDVAFRALSLGRESLDRFRALVDSNESVPAGMSGQNISYARENPEVVYTRWLVQTVGVDLMRLGAHSDVLATLRPPVPARPGMSP
jgi:hypothetical protein